MNERSKEVLDFLTTLSLGRGHTEEFLKVYEFLDKAKLRRLDKSDQRKIGVDVLYIKTRGRGTGQVLDGIHYAKADVDRVTKVYVNVYVHLENGEGQVLHIKKDSPKISVIK